MTKHPTSLEACRDLRFLVAGSGRSGTRWIAGVWTKLGFPCGHEWVFNPWLRCKPHSFVADSGQQSGAILEEIRGEYPDLLIFHQLRNPYDYVASMYGEERDIVNDPSVNERFFLDYVDIDAEDPVTAAMQVWVKWNDRIAPYSDFTYRVEECNAGTIGQMLGMLGESRSTEEIVRAFDTERNVHRKIKKLERSQVKESPYFPQFKEAMERYGY